MKHTKKAKLYAIFITAIFLAGMAAQDATSQTRRSSRTRRTYDTRDRYGLRNSRLGQSRYQSPYGYGYPAGPTGYESRRISPRDRTRSYRDSRGYRGLRRYPQQPGLPSRYGPQQQEIPQERRKTPTGRQRGATQIRPYQEKTRPSGPTRTQGTQVQPGKKTVNVAPATRRQRRVPPQARQAVRTGPQRPSARTEAKPAAQWPTFYITLNADQIIVGDVFSVDVHLSNPKKTGFDRLSVVLNYDTVFLRPVKGPPPGDGVSPELATSMIDEAKLAPRPTGIAAALETEPEPYIREAFSRSDAISLYENVIDTQQGRIVYMFELEDETAVAQGRVASVYFEALQATTRTFISFQFASASPEGEQVTLEPGTALTRAGKDVLGLPLRPDDGTINRGITILSEKPTKERVRSLDRQQISQEVYRTRLRLVPERRRVVVGEEFNVYVELENPDHVRFDQVSLLIAYNPRVLEVVDYDTDNTITQGINIHDGSYRDAFPFDFYVRNRVDPQRGLIDYRMRGYRRPLFSEGVLASIRFRGLKSTSKTTLRILVDRDGKDPTTGVFYRFKDVIGDSADIVDGITTCSLQIGRLRSAAVGSERGSGEGG